MEPYTDFASVYDVFMDTAPYRKWCDRIEQAIRKYGVSRKNPGGKDSSDPLAAERDLVVDLGCGTGTLTEMLAQEGYDMIGVDLSVDMLRVAMRKKERNGSHVLYLNQDMRELDLYCTAGTVISVCDSMNYLLEEEDILRVFGKVENFLFPGGIFIFDFNTVYKYSEVIGNGTIAEARDECSFIWDNYYDPEREINEYDVTFFVKEPVNGKEYYRRFGETHYQRGYTAEQMQKLAEQAGLKVEAVFDAETCEACTEQSERVCMILKENSKERI